METRLASPYIILLSILLFFCLGCVLVCCVGTYALYAIGDQVSPETMSPLLPRLHAAMYLPFVAVPADSEKF
jgi:hypothetical protein